MDEFDRLLTVFSGTIDDQDGTAVITVPERELDLGDLTAGETYRVALIEQPEPDSDTAIPDASHSPHVPDGPPVEEGDHREVEIEDLGEQGDGIARIGPGYVVFVPGTGIGDRVTVEITKARENFAFADVIEEEPLSD